VIFLAWLIRLLVFLPGALVILLALWATELDLWSSNVILRRKRERARQREDYWQELVSPRNPWT
jgi:hypothetical protein